MKVIVFMSIMFFLVSTMPLSAQDKCSGIKLSLVQKKVEKRDVENTFSTNEEWEIYRRHFDGNRECMSIFVTLAFGEASRLRIKNNWKQIGGLQKYKKTDVAFYNFVLSSIKDETAPADIIKEINALAKNNCPSDAASICSQILQMINLNN